MSVGIGKYDDPEVYPELPVAKEIRRMRRILEPLGLQNYPEWRAPMPRRHGQAVRDRLQHWAQTPADVAVLYWVGHGWSNGDSPTLVHAQSPRAADEDGVTPKDLATAIKRWFAASEDQPVLVVILDACRSGGFIDDLNAELSGRDLPLLLVGTATEEASTRLPGFSKLLDYLFDKVYKGCESVNLAELAIQIEVNSASTLPVYPLARRVANRSLPLQWPHSDRREPVAQHEEAVVLGAHATQDRQMFRTVPAEGNQGETRTGTTTYRLAQPSPTRTWSRDFVQVRGDLLFGIDHKTPGPWTTPALVTVQALAPSRSTGAPAAYQRLSIDAEGCSVGSVSDVLLGQLGGGQPIQNSSPLVNLTAAIDAEHDPLIVVARGVTEAADVSGVVSLLRELAAREDTEVVVEPGQSSMRSVDIYSLGDVRRFASWARTGRRRDPAQQALLMALGLGLGSGLPLRDRVWPALAEAVSDQPITIDRDTMERFCVSASRYLLRTVADNQAVYRLAKEGYRQSVTADLGAAATDLQLRIAQRCLDLATAQRAQARGMGLDPEVAINPYLQQWTAQHVLLAGPAGKTWLSSHADDVPNRTGSG